MYNPLAQFYEEVFPVSETQINFVESAITKTPATGNYGPSDSGQPAEQASPGPGRSSQSTQHRWQPRLLEIGCAIGDLAAAMAAKGIEVDAIDLNPSMIRRARERHGHSIRNPRAVQGGEAPQQYEVSEGAAPLRFYEMDMLELGARFTPESFDAVACLGNTMVHLPGPTEIERFLRDAAGLLKGGGDTGNSENPVGLCGSLILQILNYDYLLTQRPEALPPIETGNLRFERRYSYPAGTDGHITFSTRLHIKQSNQVYEDSVQLYPLKQAELQLLLQRAGFKQPSLYGGFDASALQPDSFPLIAVAGL